MMEELDDPFDLKRFLDAQRGSYESALAELRAGRKETHWSWYIFPQVLGLGSSAMSTRYAIRLLAEAQAYLAHPVLGARLRECIAALNAHTDLSAEEILGDVDAQKLRSCLTLFAQVDPSDAFFEEALVKYFGGGRDAATFKILAKWRRGKTAE
jgi:uncharacterized protein (DUF1810 family)